MAEPALRRDVSNESTAFTREEIEHYARAFAELWPNRPFDNSNGLASNGALALFYFLKRLDPRSVVEVGTWRGFSTWVIEQAVPEAHIICTDPILASRQFLNPSQFQPEYRLERVEYTWQDFSVLNIVVPPEEADECVVFFDDHQDKWPRLLQAKAKGFRHIIFDDNTPYVATHQTFEAQKEDSRFWDALMSEVEEYAVFPSLYDASHFRSGDQMQGIGIDPIEPYFTDRQYNSYVTYVRLK